MAKIQVFFKETLMGSRAAKLPSPTVNAVSVAVPSSGDAIWVRCNSEQLANRIACYKGAVYTQGTRVVRISIPPERQKSWKEHLIFLLTQDGFKVEKK